MEDRSITKKIKPTNDKAKNENERNEIKEGIRNCRSLRDKFEVGKQSEEYRKVDKEAVNKARMEVFTKRI